MSGPKYSIASIAEEMLRMLLEQAQAALDEIQKEELRKDIQNEIQTITRTISEFSSSPVSARLSRAVEYLPSDPIVEKCKRMISEVVTVRVDRKVPDTISELEQMLTELRKQYRSLLSKIKIINDTLDSLEPDIVSARREKIKTDLLTMEFSREERPASLRSQRTTELYHRLLELLADSQRYEAVVPEIDLLLVNPNLDESYKQKQLQLRIDALIVTRDTEKEKIALRARIAALLTDLGVEARELPDSVAELKELAEKLEAQFEQKVAAEYIDRAMTEVMEEVGYSIADSQIMHAGTRSTHKRVVEYSDRSVLQVATSDSGSVMFEVMSRKQGAEIDDAERYAVASDMCAFCPDYALIKSKLAERGVILSDEMLCPPEPRYVRGAAYDAGKRPNDRRAGSKGVKYNVAD